MLEAGGIRNSSELAKVLGITPQAISNYKKRGEMPTSLVFKFAERYGVSVDWLLTGSGSMMKGKGGPTEKVSVMAVIEVNADILQGKDRAKNEADDPALKSEELAYIKKLIRILRTQPDAAPAIKASIDAFSQVAFPAGGAPDASKK